MRFPDVKLDENNGSSEHPLQLLLNDWAMLSFIYGAEIFNASYILS